VAASTQEIKVHSRETNYLQLDTFVKLGSVYYVYNVQVIARVQPTELSSSGYRDIVSSSF